jgi:hypothetical protein
VKKVVFVILAALLSVLRAQMTWTCATESAPWGPRTTQGSVVFDGRMWVLGGCLVCGPPESYANDVWHSTDGADWTRLVDSAPWSRRCPEAVVFDNKMWVLGGWSNSTGGALNDVWYSSDGDSWVCATDSANWSPRGGHAVEVFDDKMWVVGGGDAGGWRRDVWCSSDGVNWTEAVHSASWDGRYYHGLVVFDGKLWLTGGMRYTCLNDVWYSADGANWTQATASADWSPRSGHGVAAFDGKIWILGGLPNPPWKLRLNDVWFSADGVDWTCATDSADWLHRMTPRPLVFDNKLWILGGDSTEQVLPMGDVWYSTGLGVEESHQPQATSYEPGPTILSGASSLDRLESCIIYDATGRRVMGSKPGVYIVRDTAAQAVWKLVVQR